MRCEDEVFKLHFLFLFAFLMSLFFLPCKRSEHTFTC